MGKIESILRDSLQSYTTYWYVLFSCQGALALGATLALLASTLVKGVLDWSNSRFVPGNSLTKYSDYRTCFLPVAMQTAHLLGHCLGVKHGLVL